MQEFIVGPPGAYRKGVFLRNGQTVRILDNELPSITWRWPDGAPVEIDLVKDANGAVTSKKLREKGAPPPPALKVATTEEEQLAALDVERERLQEAIKFRGRPALSQVPVPQKVVGDDSKRKAPESKGAKPEDRPSNSGRPSDQSPT